MKETRIKRRWKDLAREGKKGFVAYITAGDPDLASTEDIVLRLEDAGADIIELGVPFSDPLADGIPNQLAAERALAAGTTFQGILDMVTRLRTRSEIPMLFFSYLNPLLAHGFEDSVRRTAEAGLDGMLLLDLCMEEAAPYRKSLRTHHLDNIALVTPTTPDERIQGIVKHASGFVYCVSRAGVTGEQSSLQVEAGDLLRRTRALTTLPVALGFGVSTPEQARAYAEMTEGVVVGSHIVSTLHRAGPEPAARAGAISEIKKLIDAVKSV